MLAFVLLVVFSSSSKSDDPQSTREEHGHSNAHFYPRPDYPQWGSSPDWQDWQYDYYRRPRIYKAGSMFKAVFITFLACAMLMAGILLAAKESTDTRPPTEFQPK